MKVENDHFSPSTKNQYPQLESQVPTKSQITKSLKIYTNM